MDLATWILVADANKAKFYAANKTKLVTTNGDGKDLKLVSEHTHNESAKRDQDLVTDKQGHFGTGTFVEPTDPRKHEEDIFAHELASHIEHGRTQNKFHELILIAPPAFMGKLNKHISHQAEKMISLTIEKDYTGCNESELISHLEKYL